MQEIWQGDCLELMKNIPDKSVDSIVTDPPYELGFMGKSWDSTGIANNKEMWAECLRVLKPGGYLLAFSGTRTYHRMASAIEDAGFEVRDMIEWVYGSGFPKSRNVGKDIEKINVGGIKNLKQIGTKQGIKCETGTQGYSYSKEYVAGKCMGGKQISGEIPVYEINNEWSGWGTALKPAHEPICMARKPLAEKTVAENVLKYGTGGINIDESRVETKEEIGRDNRNIKNSPLAPKDGWNENSMKGLDTRGQFTGRFPANIIHDNSEEVRECFPETKSGGGNKNSVNNQENSFLGTGFGGTGTKTDWEIDSGNASRFFKSIIYQAKASKSERNKGCEELEDRIGGGMNGTENQTLLTGSGNIRNNITKNNHPTVKPIALMEYLIKMVTPKYGIVLDPFAGSGTMGVACKNLNRNFILIEKEPEYIEIIKKRLNNSI